MSGAGTRTAVAAVTGVLLAAGACARSDRWSPETLGGAVVIPSVAEPALRLTDTRGHPYDFRAATRGRIALLYFGYTHCPDVCPLQMANVAGALRRLPVRVRDQIAVVFVTVDSARDGPQRLRAWLDQFDSSFVGLTGSLAAINAYQAGTHVLAASAPQPDGHGGYTMGHSAAVLAFTRDDTAHVAFPAGVTPDGWVAGLRRLVRLGPPPVAMRPHPPG